MEFGKNSSQKAVTKLTLNAGDFREMRHSADRRQ
jgi:hypothetical protein